MTQTQLAEELFVTDKAVSKWERDLSYPDIALFPKLADVLGVTVDDLLRECKDECRPSKLMKEFEISRDIRTPLHIILGFVEIIKNNVEDPETIKKYLKGIKVSGEYMMTLLNRLQKDNCGCNAQEPCCEDSPATQEELEKYLQEQISSGRSQLPEFNFTGKRILIVEDMAINREIASEILKQTCAETEFAEDGKVCLDMVEAAPAGYYDLILMDIMMPNMDGNEAARMIRLLPDKRKADIPIIAMTSNVTEKDKNAAMAAGMNAFSEKPIFTDKLFEIMREHLDK
ncbi:MAG: response regulator [Blautia sp.]|nr:response regulator [Blautia sp.]